MAAAADELIERTCSSNQFMQVLWMQVYKHTHKNDQLSSEYGGSHSLSTNIVKTRGVFQINDIIEFQPYGATTGGRIRSTNNSHVMELETSFKKHGIDKEEITLLVRKKQNCEQVELYGGYHRLEAFKKTIEKVMAGDDDLKLIIAPFLNKKGEYELC